MDADEHKWIQMAMKHIKLGAFTKKAKAHGETPKEYMKEVLAHPEQHTEKTRKQAQFMRNIQPHHSDPSPAESHEDAPSKPTKKAKRPPTEWNKLVQKHYAMTKGQPDAFQKAIQMAKDERMAPVAEKKEAPKKAQKKKTPKGELMDS